MEVIIDVDSAVSSERAARNIAKQLKLKPSSVLGLATGSSPLKVYASLAEMCVRGEISFRSVTTFNLDEYIGVPPENEHSYRYFMNANFFDKIDIDKSRTHVPDGMAKDIEAACKSYEADIEASGGIDLQLLGIGSDGHIGFNEPSSSFASKTRVKGLASETITANARFFGNDVLAVPTHAITMGISTIMKARKICLLAYGSDKAAAVAGMIEGPISAKLPASILQMHPCVTIYLDNAAASKLDLRQYYDAAKSDLEARGEI